MINILLTGGAGFIGSHTAVELLQRNYQVIIVDNLCNSDERVIINIEKITGIKPKFFQCDITNFDALHSVFFNNHIDVVIHFAGHKAVGESVNLPLKYYDNNIRGLLTLLKCMEAFNVNKIIFSSTAAIYGMPETLPLTENSKINILNPYASSKYMSETILHDQSIATDLRVMILRYFNPVGAHSTGLIGENPVGGANNLFPVIMSVYSGKKEQLEVFGYDYNTKDGSGVRDYIHIIDLASGHIAALEYLIKSETSFEIFNLGTEKGYSVLEVINGFEKHFEQKIPYIFKERRKGDSAIIYADASKAYQVLGWKAKYDLDDMIKDCLNYFKKSKTLDK